MKDQFNIQVNIDFFCVRVDFQALIRGIFTDKFDFKFFLYVPGILNEILVRKLVLVMLNFLPVKKSITVLTTVSMLF